MVQHPLPRGKIWKKIDPSSAGCSLQHTYSHQTRSGCPVCARGIAELIGANPRGDAALLPGFLSWEHSQSPGSQQGEASLSPSGSRRVPAIPRQQGSQRRPSFSKPGVQFPSTDLSPQRKGDGCTEDSSASKATFFSLHLIQGTCSPTLSF